jgi:hypothetical protein
VDSQRFKVSAGTPPKQTSKLASSTPTKGAFEIKDFSFDIEQTL